MPSWRTIYRWIYEKYLVNGNLKVLRRKGKNHGTKETRGKYSKGKSIRKRDKSVYSRQEAGHWEADTVVSGQGKSKACFATLAERMTRYYIAVKIPDRRAETMENVIVSVLSAFPPQLVKSITSDRGAEFANWRNIEERLHCDVYFADPYCAPATLKRNLALINARPRKVLNFHSAQDLWTFELTSCCSSFHNSLRPGLFAEITQAMGRFHVYHSSPGSASCRARGPSSPESCFYPYAFIHFGENADRTPFHRTGPNP